MTCDYIDQFAVYRHRRRFFMKIYRYTGCCYGYFFVFLHHLFNINRK